MDGQLISISSSDPLWIVIAFICGWLVRLINLPPLIGFLGAGFILNSLGAAGGNFLNTTADLGITLLLFTIGLKLRIKELTKPSVWGTSLIHMTLVTFILSLLILLIAQINLPIFNGINFMNALFIGFALSFSSTVFAVKLLDDLGASSSRHGKISIGVLVVQDIAAVLFLAFSLGKLPSVWAFALVLLIPLRQLLLKLLEKTGHGELLILFGISLALGGASLFELVGIKADVGALVFGMLMANHAKSNELAKALMSLKDLFLVGFFLSIGMTMLPTWTEFFVAGIFIIFLPVKAILYFLTFSLFYLRASTSWRTTLNLTNYSEFGLILGALATSAGWLPKEWLAVFAIVLSLSFIVAAPLVNMRDLLYNNWQNKLKYYEREKRLPGDENLQLTNIKVAVFGMGRIGTAVYDVLQKIHKEKIIGVDVNLYKVDQNQIDQRNVVPGDATNPDFWAKAPGLIDNLELVILTLPSHSANITAVDQMRKLGYKGKIAATTKYKDEEADLINSGIDYTFNIFKEAGVGFANELLLKTNDQTST